MPRRLYTLSVSIIDAPGEDGVTRARDPIPRTIRLTGDQTLKDLHGAIFLAFGRWDAYVGDFLFQDGPLDCGGIRYDTPADGKGADPFDAGQPIRADTSLDTLRLRRHQSFSYWFNLWDDWYHQITVLAVTRQE